MKKFTSTYNVVYEITEKEVKQWYEEENESEKWKDLEDEEKIIEVGNFTQLFLFNGVDFWPVVNVKGGK
jgi:aspartyl aminopeptidase